MDENLGNTIARHFSSEYLNYTINFIISKEFPSFSDFPDFSLVLCDLDQNIELAKKYNLPAIAFSHENNKQETLMGTPWMILDADALSPFFLREVYCRHHHIPLMITTTSAALFVNLPSNNCLNFYCYRKKIKIIHLAASFHKIAAQLLLQKLSFRLYKKSI